MNTWNTTNRLDKRLEHVPEFFKSALVDVMDTAEMVKLWLEDSGVIYTAADLAAFTAVVLERQKQLREQEDRMEEEGIPKSPHEAIRES